MWDGITSAGKTNLEWVEGVGDEGFDTVSETLSSFEVCCFWSLETSERVSGKLVDKCLDKQPDLQSPIQPTVPLGFYARTTCFALGGHSGQS